MRGGIPRLALVAVALLTSTPGCGDDLPAALPPSAQVAAHCAVPRVGTDPGTGKPYPDQQGTSTDEKTWVRSWIDEYYLWYREVPNYRGDDYQTAVDYFAVLKTDATTASGAPKDHFHFTYPSAVWTALSQSGVEAGYGATWAVIAPRPPSIARPRLSRPSTDA